MKAALRWMVGRVGYCLRACVGFVEFRRAIYKARKGTVP